MRPEILRRLRALQPTFLVQSFEKIHHGVSGVVRVCQYGKAQHICLAFEFPAVPQLIRHCRAGGGRHGCGTGLPSQEDRCQYPRRRRDFPPGGTFHHARQMPLRNVCDFMRHHGGQFSLGASRGDETREHSQAPARPGKSVDQFAFNQEEPQTFRIPCQALSQAVSEILNVTDQQGVFDKRKLLAGCRNEFAPHRLFRGRNHDARLGWGKLMT